MKQLSQFLNESININEQNVEDLYFFSLNTNDKYILEDIYRIKERLLTRETNKNKEQSLMAVDPFTVDFIISMFKEGNFSFSDLIKSKHWLIIYCHKPQSILWSGIYVDFDNNCWKTIYPKKFDEMYFKGVFDKHVLIKGKPIEKYKYKMSNTHKKMFESEIKQIFDLHSIDVENITVTQNRQGLLINVDLETGKSYGDYKGPSIDTYTFSFNGPTNSGKMLYGTLEEKKKIRRNYLGDSMKKSLYSLSSMIYDIFMDECEKSEPPLIDADIRRKYNDIDVPSTPFPHFITFEFFKDYD